ncbi:MULTISPECIES: PA1571 family protein [Acinetobacter]|jgi:hypothetical protein|uniref:Uncharacterized protein n=1 Tax=Acinetobacter tjernbergiae DSM 14971 = CIP 107465 TaxID=1120928 RepID=V2V2N4_9GAMM|nr:MULTISPECIES: PA1571 family protein [Acinetobacter]MBH2002229.1 hypothetical protein [Moraxellaceae bacterium]ESK55180.1 hypothetical protein F990_02104 [Acinetobacter tjernbergiae DSM 14971 = CIP 107465]MBH2029074.1 hypothetical protein [Moraxellaceae bacterium]MBP9787000.1 hypothetical protein [Acinetobacter sp.]MCH7310423.1 hypothetical protein [Acinetobacter sp. ANC 4805]
MHVSERLVNHGLKHVLDSNPVNTCYMVDSQGKEVQITTAMIRLACHQLLQRCRTIKK